MIRVFSVVLVAVVTSPGCAQLAGIDDTSGKDRKADTLTFQRMSIGNTVITSDLNLTGLEANYLVANPASATGFDLVAADNGKAPDLGTWHADLPEPVPVAFTLPDVPAPIPRLFAFPNRQLLGLFAILEHPGRSPAPPGAMLTVTAPLEVASVATDSFAVVTVGSWTSRTFSVAEVPVGSTQFAPPAYAFATATSTSGRPELDRLTRADSFLVLRYSGTVLTGVADATPFEQTGNDIVAAPMMVPVVADQPLNLTLSPPTLATRYASVRPAVASLSMNWSVVAAPGSNIGSNSGPVLQSGGLLLTDVGVAAMYRNPFAALPRSWGTIFTLATSESRTYMAPTPIGPLPVTLFAGMNQFLDLTAGPPPASAELTLDAGLPVTISLDGAMMLTDGATKLVQPTRFVEVSFTADRPTATLYGVQVFDLLPNSAATALEFHLVLAASGSEPKFELPPDIFLPGHSYTLRVVCTLGGFPGIADGDLQTRTLPLTQGFFDSAVFTVMP
jgi:hypothetical protein